MQPTDTIIDSMVQKIVNGFDTFEDAYLDEEQIEILTRRFVNAIWKYVGEIIPASARWFQPEEFAETFNLEPNPAIFFMRQDAVEYWERFMDQIDYVNDLLDSKLPDGFKAIIVSNDMAALILLAGKQISE